MKHRIILSLMVVLAGAAADTFGDGKSPWANDDQAQLAAKNATILSGIEADCGIRMVPIPKDTFEMDRAVAPAAARKGRAGAPPAEVPPEMPVTKVTLTSDYFMSQTPVTQGQYETVMDTDPSIRVDPKKGASVDSVSWDDAIAFCGKLTAKEKAAGNLPDGFIFSLPTEAQWSHAVLWGPDGVMQKIHDFKIVNASTGPRGRVIKVNYWSLSPLTRDYTEMCLDRFGGLPGGEVTDPFGPETGTGRIERAGVQRLRLVHDEALSNCTFRVVLIASGDKLAAAMVEPPDPHVPPQAGQSFTIPGQNIVMKYIAPGTFMMGSPDEEIGHSAAETPQAKVTISKGFWLAETPMHGDGLLYGPPVKDGYGSPETDSWVNAVYKCGVTDTREQLAGRVPRGYAYQLPTEAQWEYACRAGTTGPAPGDVTGLAWTAEEMKIRHGVHGKQPNAWGLYDMIGLVPQWCLDAFEGPYPTYPGNAVTDPLGAVPGDLDVVRAFRGGTRVFGAQVLRSAFRDGADCNNVLLDKGYRLALTPAVDYPQRQTDLDAINFILNKGPAFAGNLWVQRKKIPFKMTLNQDPAAQLMKGTISFPTLNAKMTISTVMINDHRDPVELHLIETGVVDKDSTDTIPRGIGYAVTFDPAAQGILKGKWFWPRQNPGRSGGFEMQPGDAPPGEGTNLGGTATIDAGVIGTWHSPAGTPDRTWTIRADGFYRLGSGQSEETGQTDFANGNFRLIGDPARTDQGHYVNTDKDTLSITGAAGTEVWTRVAVAEKPTAPADKNIPAGMSLIPGGPFTMGDTLEKDPVPDNAPVQGVNVSAFYMDQKIVSGEVWMSTFKWAGKNGYHFEFTQFLHDDDLPVTTMDWWDAVKWCNARSEQEKLTPAYYTDDQLKFVYRQGLIREPFVNWTANGYRLPTEAEWEKAARGGLEGKRFPWGNMISGKMANYSGRGNFPFDLGTGGANGTFVSKTPSVGFELTGGRASPVGFFAPNGYGLQDMSGNVRQWCWDVYNSPYQGGTDPHGPPPVVRTLSKDFLINPGNARVVRGGSYASFAKNAECGTRDKVDPANAILDLGFRTVRVVDATNTPASPAAAPDAAEVQQQHQSVRLIAQRGMYLYQMTVYPGFWSEPIVAPETNQSVGFGVLSEGTALVRMQLNGEDSDLLAQMFNTRSNGMIRFRAVGDKPVAISVRCLGQVPFLPRDKLFTVSKDYQYHAVDAPALPADRKAMDDALISVLKASPKVTLARKVGRYKDELQAELSWDESLQMVSGWTSSANGENKKRVIGRVIDDLQAPVFLQLIEESPMDETAREAGMGGFYRLRLSKDGNSLAGQWVDQPNSWTGRPWMNGSVIVTGAK